jgi:hypothetical protein
MKARSITRKAQISLLLSFCMYSSVKRRRLEDTKGFRLPFTWATNDGSHLSKSNMRKKLLLLRRSMTYRKSSKSILDYSTLINSNLWMKFWLQSSQLQDLANHSTKLCPKASLSMMFVTFVVMTSLSTSRMLGSRTCFPFLLTGLQRSSLMVTGNTFWLTKSIQGN